MVTVMVTLVVTFCSNPRVARLAPSLLLLRRRRGTTAAAPTGAAENHQHGVENVIEDLAW